VKLIPLLVALVALPLIVSGALASTPEDGQRGEILRPTKFMVLTSTGVVANTKVTTKLRPPPLVLPDVGARVLRLQHADRKWLTPQLRKSKQVVHFFQKHRWLTAPKHEKCWGVAWQRQCTLARAKLKLNRALVDVAENRLLHEIPLINDWRTAVRWVQRIYPGTESWMLYISDREGGWGPWVWYGGRTWSGYHVGNDYLGADTVGGWMQFRYSTFAPYWRQAQEDLRERGYTLPLFQMPPEGGPSKYVGWLSPLAQALTAGYMRSTGKDGCHWCL
jgi:hypothetical protein